MTDKERTFSSSLLCSPALYCGSFHLRCITSLPRDSRGLYDPQSAQTLAALSLQCIHTDFWFCLRLRLNLRWEEADRQSSKHTESAHWVSWGFHIHVCIPDGFPFLGVGLRKLARLACTSHLVCALHHGMRQASKQIKMSVSPRITLPSSTWYSSTSRIKKGFGCGILLNIAHARRQACDQWSWTNGLGTYRWEEKIKPYLRPWRSWYSARPFAPCGYPVPCLACKCPQHW